MQRIIMYSDGNWSGINKAGVEVYGTTPDKILQEVSDMVNNEPDDTTKRIEEVIKESEQRIEEVNKEKDFIEQELSESVQATIEMTKPLRKLLRTADDETILENAKYLERFEIDKEYVENDLFVHRGKVYRVIQSHTSQADWLPEEVKSLYQDLSGTMDEDGNEIISDWKQPAGGHDLYSKGDKVTYEGKTWELIGEDTGHAPGTVKGVWVEVDQDNE